MVWNMLIDQFFVGSTYCHTLHTYKQSPKSLASTKGHFVVRQIKGQNGEEKEKDITPSLKIGTHLFMR